MRHPLLPLLALLDLLHNPLGGLNRRRGSIPQTPPAPPPTTVLFHRPGRIHRLGLLLWRRSRRRRPFRINAVAIADGHRVPAGGARALQAPLSGRRARGFGAHGNLGALGQGLEFVELCEGIVGGAGGGLGRDGGGGLGKAGEEVVETVVVAVCHICCFEKEEFFRIWGGAGGAWGAELKDVLD